MPIGRSDYKERKEQKIERLEEKAVKAKKESEAYYKKADAITSAIPFGQPIMVGHHSEKTHRAAVKKIETAHRKSRDAHEKATYYEDKADTAASNHAISGDNPEAANLYKDKLAKLEAQQRRMKAINKAWPKGSDALHSLGLTDEEIEKLRAGMRSYEKKPFPSWALSNNSAEIRRVKEKLESLSELDGMAVEVFKFSGGEMRVDMDKNRVQFLFADIPSIEIRSILKSNGFRWAPSEGAWQRQRTIIAIRIAKSLIEQMEG